MHTRSLAGREWKWSCAIFADTEHSEVALRVWCVGGGREGEGEGHELTFGAHYVWV